MVETDPMKCPGCGGPADNGHDRELPPNPYYCEACVDAGLPSMLAAMADANRAFDDFDWDTD